MQGTGCAAETSRGQNITRTNSERLQSGQDNRIRTLLSMMGANRANGEKFNVLSCLMAALCIFFCAEVKASSDWDWGGFVSQSGVYTSDNSFFGGNTDNRVSGEFSEAGVIGTGTLYDKFDFATQVISRRQGTLAEGNPKIDYLQVIYRFDEKMNYNQAFKLGRFKTPLGFYNETREVPFTRSGIILPQGLYWEKVRNMRSFINGGQYMLDFRSGLSEYYLRASYGELQVDQAEINAQAGTDGTATVKAGNLSNFALFYDYDGGRVRLGLSRMATDLEIIPSSTALVNPDGSFNIYNRRAGVDVNVNILSAEYNAQRWSYIVEYLRGKIFTGQLNAFFNGFTDYPEACYGQITYRTDNAVEFFVRYDSQENSGDDPRGSKFVSMQRDLLNKFHVPESVFPISPKYSRYAFDKTIGVGWRPTSDFLIRAEWHRVIGTSWIANYGLNSERLSKEWDLVAIQLSYRFK